MPDYDRRDYEQFAAALRSVLAPLGEVRISAPEGQAAVALVSASGRSFDFSATLAGIFTAVERLDGEVLAAAQDASPLEGKLRLFSVHVEEAIATAAAGSRNLELRSYGVVATG